MAIHEGVLQTLFINVFDELGLCNQMKPLRHNNYMIVLVRYCYLDLSNCNFFSVANNVGLAIKKHVQRLDIKHDKLQLKSSWGDHWLHGEWCTFILTLGKYEILFTIRVTNKRDYKLNVVVFNQSLMRQKIDAKLGIL